jgi:hypothetical protein
LHARTLQSLVNFNDHSISLGTFNWQSLWILDYNRNSGH